MAQFRRSKALRRWLACAGALTLIAGMSVGCRRSSRAPGNPEVQPSYNRETGRLERITYDRNHDGKPDAWLFMNGTHVVMAQLDENFDGSVDRWEYYGERSKPEASETAQQSESMPDLARNVLERAEQATRGDGKVTRWEKYERGQLVRVEEDTTGSGRVDKWETWSGGAIQLLELDTKGTGRPDRRLVYPQDGSPPHLELDRNGDGHFTPIAPTR